MIKYEKGVFMTPQKIFRFAIIFLLIALWIWASIYGARTGARMALAVPFCAALILGIGGSFFPESHNVPATALALTIVYFIFEALDNVFGAGTYFSTYMFQKGFADGLGMVLILLSFLTVEKPSSTKESG